MGNISAIRETLPMLLSVKDAPKIGITKAAYYRLTHRSDVPVILIGGRKYINRDKFITWMNEHTGGTENV